MDLFHRRPSIEARKAMSNTALNLKHMPGNRYNEITNAEKGLQNATGHKEVKIVNSGNSAILAVMSTFKSKIMVPDQGGWTGFRKMAEFMGLETVDLATELGVIDIKVLMEKLEKFKPEALFITSFAGYMAEQPLKDIFHVCDDMGVVMVEDASGGIGDVTGRLGNGEHTHVIIASTGSPKTVNIGNGGFISTNDPKLFGSAKHILKVLKADPVTCAGIASEIKNAPHILSKTMESCRFLKTELMEFREVLHHKKRGINVAVPDKNPKKLAYHLRKKFNVHGGSMITVCPHYDRVNTSAVCIEIKNLDIKCMAPENLDEILQILKTPF